MVQFKYLLKILNMSTHGFDSTVRLLTAQSNSLA